MVDFLKITFFLLLVAYAGKVQAQTCAGCTPISGGSITVNSGEVYCLPSGTWSGSVTLNAGGTICIAAGATFDPSISVLDGTIINHGSMSFAIWSGGPYSGTIINYGTFTSAGFNGTFTGTIKNHGQFTLGQMQNFSGILENHNTVNINGWHTLLAGSLFENHIGGTINVNSGGQQSGSIENSGTMIFASGAQVNGIVNNYGFMQFNGSLNILSATYLTNDSVLEFVNTNNINFAGPMLTNNGTLTVSGGSLAMNSPVSQLHNNGRMIISGDVLHNQAGSKIVNNCSILCNRYFVGNGMSENNGLIWVDTLFEVQGGPSFLVNGKTGHIQGVNFTNTGYISGYGSFYFTGTTNNVNAMGPDSFVGDSAENPILFYDTSPTGPIFDSTSGSINVVRPPSMLPIDVDDFDCSIIPPSVAGYPPTTEEFSETLCEPATILIPLEGYVEPHEPVDGIPFTVLYSTIKLFEYDNNSNPTNNSTELTIPGKGVFTANTTTGLVTFVPDVAFTSGEVEAEYRISNERAGDPIVYPSGRTKITITFESCDEGGKKLITNPHIRQRVKN